MMDIESVLIEFGFPVATALIGWFGNAYRNKQMKEKDVLGNVQSMLDMKEREMERMRAEVDRAHSINDRNEVALDKHEAEIRSRTTIVLREHKKCSWVQRGNDCPVKVATDAYEEEKLEEHSDCSKCPVMGQCEKTEQEND